jgi:hypothetical protein
MSSVATTAAPLDLRELIERARMGPAAPTGTMRAAQERVRTRRAERAKGENRSLLSDAISTEWVMSWAGRAIDRAFIEFDPDFVLTADRLGTIEKEWGLSAEQMAQLSSVGSEGELQVSLRQMDQINRSRERLAASGYTGVGATLLASILDPAALALDAATWGATAPLTRGTKALRLRHAIRGGIAGIASAGGTEAAIATMDPQRGIDDVILAGSMGLAFGAPLGAAFGPTAQKTLDKAMRGVQRQIIAKELSEGGVLEVRVTEKGRKLGFTKEATTEERKRVVTSLMVAQNERLAGLPGSRPAFNLEGLGDEGLGNMVARFTEDAEDLYEQFGPAYTKYSAGAVAGEVPRARYGRWRFGIAGRLGSSDHNDVRTLGLMLVEDALPRLSPEGKSIAVNTPATQWVMRMHTTEMADFNRKALAGFDRWLVEKGEAVNWANRPALEDQFLQEVGERVLRGDLEDASDAVGEMAMDYRARMNKLREVGQRYGVKGFENLSFDPRYFSRMPSGEKITETIRRAGRQADGSIDWVLGEDTVAELIALGMRKAALEAAEAAGEEIDDAMLDIAKWRKSAKNYLATIRRAEEDGRYFERAQLFSGRLEEDSIEVLRQAGFTEGEIARLGRALEQKSDARSADIAAERGAPASGRRRTLLDEDMTYSASNGETLTMDDLFERNAGRVLEVYARQVYGAAAGRDILRVMGSRTGRKIETYDDLIRALRDRNERGATPRQRAKFERDLRRIDAGWRAMMGWRQPSTVDPEVGRALQEMRNYNFIRLMNMMGFAQLPEVGTVLGEVGWRAMLKQMPALKRIYARSRETGELEGGLLSQLEQITGLGTHRLNGRVISRRDQTDVGFEYQGRKLSRVMRRGKVIVSDISGLNAVNQALYRSFMLAQTQKWADIAAGRAKAPGARRLALIGLDQKRFDEMLEQIRKHSTTHTGEMGGRITDLGLDKWDPQARGDFIDTLSRVGRRAVQENDIGQSAAWMNSDLGQVLVQFKSFVFAAYEKQLLAGVATRDIDIFAAWSYSMMMAGLGYTAQMSMASVGRTDREEFVEQRLNPREIAKAAFARSGYSSLIPGFIDQSAFALGSEKMFSFGRASGLASDFVAGNPVMDSIDKIAKIPAAVRGMIEAGQVTDREMQQIGRVLPFQNAAIIGNVLRAIGATENDE